MAPPAPFALAASPCATFWPPAALTRRRAQVLFVSADGYGTRLPHHLLQHHPGPLLAYMIDGVPMQRDQGLVRLIVAEETDDALHQVKWLASVTVSPDAT